MTGMLQQILVPNFLLNLQEFLAEWERMVDEYEMQNGAAIADKIEIAVLIKNSPSELRTLLQVHNGESETFASIRQNIKQFVQASKAWDVVHKGPNAMDVDAVARGKGKSKGKGDRKRCKRIKL